MKKIFTTFFGVLAVLTSMAQNYLIIEELELERTKDKSLVYKAFSGDAELSISTTGVNRINMETGAGEVNIQQSPDHMMRVEAEIVVAAKSLYAAYQSVDDHLRLALTKEGSEVFLVSMYDYEKDDWKEPFGFFKTPARKVNLNIYLPKGLYVKLNDRSGELKIRDLANDLSITDASGNIWIDGVEGNLRLVDHSGEVNINNVNENASGKYYIDIIDHSGELSLYNVKGKTRIKDYSGGLFVDYLDGELEVDDTSGSIKVNGVNGTVSIDDASGGITVTNTNGSVEVSDASGGIYINEVSQDVFVRENGSGGLKVHNIGGRVTGEVRKLRNNIL